SAPSPVGEVFRAGYTELAKLQKRRQENVDTASEALLGDIESIQRALDRARTTATTEMESRVPLLVATAIGLMAAIPAVMAYNYFSRRIRVIASDMETFSSDFLNIVRRRFF